MPKGKPDADGVMRYETAAGEKVEQPPLFHVPPGAKREAPLPPEEWLTRARALVYVQRRATYRWDSGRGMVLRGALVKDLDLGNVPGLIIGRKQLVYARDTVREWYEREIENRQWT